MTRSRNQVHAHELVVKMAKDIAGAVYEECAKRSNEWYKMNPSQTEFIERTYGSLLQQAREALAMSLNSPALDQQQKDLIADALIKDSTLQRRGGHKVLTRH